MTAKNILDALEGIDFNMVWDAAFQQTSRANSTPKPKKTDKKRKSNPIKWVAIAAGVLICVALLPILLNIFRNSSDVQLTGISGGVITELPAGVSELNAGSNATYTLLRASARNELTDEDFQQPEDVDVVGNSTLSSIPQTVVLFDDNKYASITITLDNPYEYYICDFYMTSSQPDAMIFVDNKWLPLDGSVKIRWTGSTNREATYTVYLPTVSGDTTITITDMRYLNKTEIAVDLAEHNVANVYNMETPLKTEFVVNTTEGFYFRVITTESCLSYTVEGAVPAEDAGIYKLETNGTYRVKYTYSIPGTDLTGEGEIVSEEIELLKVYIESSPWYVNTEREHSEYGMYTIYGANCQIAGIVLRGTGMTFHEADLNDISEQYFRDCYFCDANLKISISGSEFGRCIYFENAANGKERFGWMSVILKDPIADDFSGTRTITIQWNGYTIYTGRLYPDPS